jgi:hypothetical protein
VTVARGGTFDVTVRVTPVNEAGVVKFRLAGTSAEDALPSKAEGHTFRGLQLSQGDAKLEAWVERGGAAVGAWDVEVRRVK